MEFNVDFGFAYQKLVAENNKRVIFPSTWGEIIQDSFNFRKGDNQLGITTEDGSWLFGQDALNQSLLVSHSKDNSWFLSNEYKAGILLAISEVSQASRVPVELMLSLPFSAWDTIRSQVIENLAGQHSIKRIGRNKQLIDIAFDENFPAMPQNFAPLFMHFLDEKGGATLPETNREWLNIAVFNGGGNTIEYSTIRFNPRTFQIEGIRNQSGTEVKGMFNLSSVVKTAIASQYKRELDDHEAFRVILTNILEVQNQDIDVSEVVKPIKEHYLNTLLNICNQTWIRGQRVTKNDLFAFIISGGQGPLLKQFFNGYHNNILMSDNPQWDVVEGMSRLRKALK